MSGGHPIECGCFGCIRELQHNRDRAQAQTLSMMDLLCSIRRDLRQLHAVMGKRIDGLDARIEAVIGTEQRKAPKPARGFARLSVEERRRVASQGGKISQAKGTAHRYDSQSGAEAGKKGGAYWRGDPGHLSEIGSKGGKAKRGHRQPRKPPETPDNDSR